MTVRTAIRASAVAFFLATAVASADAAPVLLVDGAGKLTGATGVDVGGVLYDVTFGDGSCVDLFSGCDEAGDFPFQTEAAALAAAQALLDQVFVDGASGQFDSDPSLTAGCAPNTFTFGNSCSVLIPFSSAVQGAAAHNEHPTNPSPDRTGVFFGSADNQLADTRLTYAVFTAQSVAVPEPTLMLLLGTGLAGLAARRRRRP